MGMCGLCKSQIKVYVQSEHLIDVICLNNTNFPHDFSLETESKSQNVIEDILRAVY